MALMETPAVQPGWKAIPFRLKGTDGKIHTLEDVRGPSGLLVMFICNHCPYVQAILDRLVRDTAELKQHGVGCVGIMSNDTEDYPEDSFENMGKLARAKNFSFPYLIDETQEVARAYDAICTPDFFGFDRDLKLQYRGRLDASKMNPAPKDAKRELFEAMVEIANTGKTTIAQNPSMGCSIKWRQAA